MALPPLLENHGEPVGSEIRMGTATVVLGVRLTATVGSVLFGNEGIELLGVCRDGAEAMMTVARLRPDVLLVPAEMEGLSLVALLRQMRAQAYATKTLVVTERCDRQFICPILLHGAKGCVHPGSSPAYFAKAILAVKNGDIWLERGILANALADLSREIERRGTLEEKPNSADSRKLSSLSQRERQIVALLAEGLTNKEIAQKLKISGETVKKHLKKVFDKLGVHRRTQVVQRQLCDRRVAL
jgi:RNA polymerase sigma factor (sigma-70 family)